MTILAAANAMIVRKVLNATILYIIELLIEGW